MEVNNDGIMDVDYSTNIVIVQILRRTKKLVHSERKNLTLPTYHNQLKQPRMKKLEEKKSNNVPSINFSIKNDS